MEENKNTPEEVIPTVEETVTEQTNEVVETPVVAEEAAPKVEAAVEVAPVIEEKEEEIKEVIEEAPSAKKVEEPAVIVPESDFDWDAYEKGVSISEEEKANLEKTYDDTLNAIKDKEVVEGKVISINKREVVVNVGYKSDGIVPMSEFRYNPDLKVGDVVEVYIESQEDKKGQLVLSHKKCSLPLPP